MFRLLFGLGIINNNDSDKGTCVQSGPANSEAMFRTWRNGITNSVPSICSMCKTNDLESRSDPGQNVFLFTASMSIKHGKLRKNEEEIVCRNSKATLRMISGASLRVIPIVRSEISCPLLYVTDVLDYQALLVFTTGRQGRVTSGNMLPSASPTFYLM
jgi:hypothetical protein